VKNPLTLNLSQQRVQKPNTEVPHKKNTEDLPNNNQHRLKHIQLKRKRQKLKTGLQALMRKIKKRDEKNQCNRR